MDRAERIAGHYPRTFKSWDKGSRLRHLLDQIGGELDSADREISSMMRSHWVDTASGRDLDCLGMLVGTTRIGGESDAEYRGRLKRAVQEYRGGGTVHAILEGVRALIGSTSDDDVTILENPPEEVSTETRVMAGGTWRAGSMSVEDALPTITLLVEEGGEVKDPFITNGEADEGFRFDGTLKSGQRLTVSPGSAKLDGEEVTGRVAAKKYPRLLRGGSDWSYRESLSAKMGIFDSGRFDESLFTEGIPYVRILKSWTSLLPSTFEVRIKAEAMKRAKVPVGAVEAYVGAMKAAGVKARVIVV